ncbi:MAG: PfkB family carbohydrate kinase, partial [Candidatus Omnitrophota bacterium]
MKQFKFSSLKNIVDKFDGKKRVLVIGDLLLDQFIWGDVSRISPEAPVPVVWVKKEGFMPGGACNVANNLAHLGAEVSIIGIVGEDDNAGILLSLLKERGISTDGILEDNRRPTILKTRVIAHHQQVVRIDRENVDHIDGRYFKKIKEYIDRNIHNFDAIIIEDYGKGLISPALIKYIVQLAKKYGKLVSVDPKENHFSYYKEVGVITPNHHEAAKAVGFPVNNEESRMKAGRKLLKDNKAEVILLTLGEEGMMVFEKGKKAPHKIPTLAQEVFDV